MDGDERLREALLELEIIRSSESKAMSNRWLLWLVFKRFQAALVRTKRFPAFLML